MQNTNALPAVDPRSMGGQTLQRTGNEFSQIVRAMESRSLVRIEAAVKAEAMVCGSSCMYGWQVNNRASGKKELIEGISIDGAMILFRHYGNATITLGDLQELPDSWVFLATFTDLESNVSIPRQFRQAKGGSMGKRMDEQAERMADLKFQIGQSKALRNVILMAMPANLKAIVLDAAKSGARKGVEETIKKHGLETVQNAAVKKMLALGVELPELLYKFSRKAPAALTVDDLVLIQADKLAIEEHRDTAEELYPKRAATPAVPIAGETKAAESLDELAEQGTPAATVAGETESAAPSGADDDVPF